MNEHVGLGLVRIIFGGMLNGSFALPMKRMPFWKWENTWLVYSLIGMVVFPWLFAMATVPQLGQVYHQASWHVLTMALLLDWDQAQDPCCSAWGLTGWD